MDAGDALDIEAKTEFWEHAVTVGFLGASQDTSVDRVKCDTSCYVARALKCCGGSVEINLWSCRSRVDYVTVATLRDVVSNRLRDLTGKWVDAVDSY